MVLHLMTEFWRRITDLWRRNVILVIALLVWSGATALQGLTQNFGGLLAVRITLGLAEAFATPPIYRCVVVVVVPNTAPSIAPSLLSIMPHACLHCSMIADYFDEKLRGTANGIFSFGIYVGNGLASLSLIFTSHLGWRTTSFIVGSVGGFMALLQILLVREPARRPRREEALPPPPKDQAALLAEEHSPSQGDVELTASPATPAPRDGEPTSGQEQRYLLEEGRPHKYSSSEAGQEEGVPSATSDGVHVPPEPVARGQRNCCKVFFGPGPQVRALWPLLCLVLPLHAYFARYLTQGASLWKVYAEIFSSPTVVLVFLASCCRYIGGFAIATYLPQFYEVCTASAAKYKLPLPTPAAVLALCSGLLWRLL